MDDASLAQPEEAPLYLGRSPKYQLQLGLYRNDVTMTSPVSQSSAILITWQSPATPALQQGE